MRSLRSDLSLTVAKRGRQPRSVLTGASTLYWPTVEVLVRALLASPLRACGMGMVAAALPHGFNLGRSLELIAKSIAARPNKCPRISLSLYLDQYRGTLKEASGTAQERGTVFRSKILDAKRDSAAASAVDRLLDGRLASRKCAAASTAERIPASLSCIADCSSPPPHAFHRLALPAGLPSTTRDGAI